MIKKTLLLSFVFFAMFINVNAAVLANFTAENGFVNEVTSFDLTSFPEGPGFFYNDVDVESILPFTGLNSYEFGEVGADSFLYMDNQASIQEVNDFSFEQDFYLNSTALRNDRAWLLTSYANGASTGNGVFVDYIPSQELFRTSYLVANVPVYTYNTSMNLEDQWYNLVVTHNASNNMYSYYIDEILIFNHSHSVGTYDINGFSFAGIEGFRDNLVLYDEILVFAQPEPPVEEEQSETSRFETVEDITEQTFDVVDNVAGLTVGLIIEKLVLLAFMTGFIILFVAMLFSLKTYIENSLKK